MNEIQQAKIVEELKSARYVNDKPFVVPLKIAILSFNDSKTISACIDKTMNQGIIPEIEITDTGSKDGTPELIEAQIKNDYWFPAKIIIKREKILLPKHQAKAVFRENAVKETNSKYILFLNANVMLPPYCIRPLIKLLESDERLAMAGLRYEPRAYHLQLGAAIIKTEIAKQLDWSVGNQCACRTLRDQLVAKGYKIEQADDMIASHFTGLV